MFWLYWFGAGKSSFFGGYIFSPIEYRGPMFTYPSYYPGPGTSNNLELSRTQEIDFPFFLYFSISKIVGIVYEAGLTFWTLVGFKRTSVPKGFFLFTFYGGKGISLNLSSFIKIMEED